MGVYIVKRLMLIVPTLLGIMTINFLIVQTAPGGPVDRVIMQMRGLDAGAMERITKSAGDTGKSFEASGDTATGYEGARGLDPEFIAELEKQFGFDRPLHERYLMMLWDYMRLEFGESYYQDKAVLDLIIERMPVSISLGFWTLIISYGISIPLGIRKAVRDGTPFDVWTSAAIFMGYAIPSFLLAIFLIVVFCGGNYLDFFPLRGLTSPNFENMTFLQKVGDYLWHIILPVFAIVVGQFALLTMLTKNLFLEEISKQFVLTARAKGLTDKRVLYGHVFRNAMLIVIAGMPGAFVGVLLIEVIFSLNGMGLLGYEAAINRDYPILFGTVFIFTLISLIMHLAGDITYTLVDPRIDFETREA